MIAFITFSCKNEKSNVKSDLELANLKGKVWKIEKTVHSAVGKAVCPAAEKDGCNNSTFVYNKNGNLIESSENDDNGKTSLSIEYVYDRHDICKEIDKYSGDVLKGKEVNNFKDGQLIEVKIFKDDGYPENIFQYEYTGTEQTGGKILDGTGKVISSYRNEYLNGQVNKQIQMDKTGDPVTVTIFTRNEKNDITEYLISNPKENSEYKVTLEYEYDNEGNWIKQIQKSEGEIVAIIMRNITYFNS